MVVQLAKKIISSSFQKFNDYRILQEYKELYKLMTQNAFKIDCKNLALWRKKWSVFDLKFYNASYQIFSSFIGEDVNICPPEILKLRIEPILNEMCFGAFYRDKNNISRFIPNKNQAKTIVRKFYGCFYDADYKNIVLSVEKDLMNILEPYEKIIIKPTNSLGGRGIEVFFKKADTWINNKGEYLNLYFLQKIYRTDFVLQEFVKQNSLIKMFNPSSVNTFRVMTYRSVLDNQVVIPHIILRVGRDGAIVDNASLGGMFCKIEFDGYVEQKFYDLWGRSQDNFNGIDLSQNKIFVPFVDKIVPFVKEMADYIPEQRLIAWDIVFDEEETPKVIEFNYGAFCSELFQIPCGSLFGEYTTEIIDYCCKHRHIKYYLSV